MRLWAFIRRIEYALGFALFCGLIGTASYYLWWYQAPTCFDNFMNGAERDIDCGGACTRICSIDVIQPEVLWTRAFKVTDGLYNVVAYIENRNLNAGTPSLTYTVSLYDKDGLITSRTGEAVLPPDSVYPVFEGRIQTGNRVPTQAFVELGGSAVWHPAEVGAEQFVVERRELKDIDTKPRLVATLRNTFLDEAKDVEIVATIFDQKGTALTSSRTTVPYFHGRSTEEVTFTWPSPIAKSLRSCEVPTDVVLAIDLSGSMNDDGGTPPEPVTSVLKAAESFISRLKSQDQVSVVTYATLATTNEVLTNERSRIADVVSNLTILPESERGSTNTGDAIMRAQEELSSARHSSDARKVLVLLTDGLATAPGDDPEGYALTRASEIKKLGVDVFTIGLGAKANTTFLSTIATDAAHALIAPNASAVDGIYRTITTAICEDGPAVIEIIPKTATSFTPLQ